MNSRSLFDKVPPNIVKSITDKLTKELGVWKSHAVLGSISKKTKTDVETERGQELYKRSELFDSLQFQARTILREYLNKGGASSCRTIQFVVDYTMMDMASYPPRNNVRIKVRVWGGHQVKATVKVILGKMNGKSYGVKDIELTTISIPNANGVMEYKEIQLGTSGKPKCFGSCARLSDTKSGLKDAFTLAWASLYFIIINLPDPKQYDKSKLESLFFGKGAEEAALLGLMRRIKIK